MGALFSVGFAMVHRELFLLACGLLAIHLQGCGDSCGGKLEEATANLPTGDDKKKCEGYKTLQNTLAGIKDENCDGGNDEYNKAAKDVADSKESVCCAYTKGAGEAKKEAADKECSDLGPGCNDFNKCKIFTEKRTELLADGLFNDCAGADGKAAAKKPLEDVICELKNNAGTACDDFNVDYRTMAEKVVV